jgi:ribosomal-protein-alanine N-acetyltransferase
MSGAAAGTDLLLGQFGRRDSRKLSVGVDLYDDPFDPGWGPELAFFFHPRAWGQGYGAELSLAALDVADTKIGLPLVSAFAHPNNVASQKLLQKVGFQPERHVESMNRILYRRRRPAL